MLTTGNISRIVKSLLFSALLATTAGCAGPQLLNTSNQATATPETGSGELVITRIVNLPGGNNSNVRTNAEGTIPFIILYDAKTKLFNIQGEGKGDGNVKYEGPDCTGLGAYYILEYNITGVLVPQGGVVAGKEGKGCYMVFNITEIWQETIETVGTCWGISTMVAVPAGWENKYGPYTIDPIVDGSTANDTDLLNPTMIWNYTVTVQKLNIPGATGCFLPEVIIVPNKRK